MFNVLEAVAAPVTALINGASKIVGDLVTGDDRKAAAQRELLALAQGFQLEIAKVDQQWAATQAEVIKAEAQSESWLARSWRPILMLTFGGLIVARWFGWSGSGLTEREVLELWAIVKYGLSGYVVGRSMEKTAPAIAEAMAAARAK